MNGSRMKWPHNTRAHTRIECVSTWLVEHFGYFLFWHPATWQSPPAAGQVDAALRVVPFQNALTVGVPVAWNDICPGREFHSTSRNARRFIIKPQRTGCARRRDAAKFRRAHHPPGRHFLAPNFKFKVAPSERIAIFDTFSSSKVVNNEPVWWCHLSSSWETRS